MAIHQNSLMTLFMFFLELSKHKIYEGILMMLVLTKFKYKSSCFIELRVGNKFCSRKDHSMNFG